LLSRRAIRTLLIALAFGLVGPVSAAETEPTADHPLGPSKLSIVDGSKPQRRRIVFKARWQGTGQMENPTFAGATLRIDGTGLTDGDTGTIQLDRGKWHPLGNPPGSGGYRYRDDAGSVGGIRSIVVKQRKKGGVFKVVGGRENWRYAVSGPQSGITFTFTIGKARWCAEFQQPSFKRNASGRIDAKAKTAPAACPCEQFESTFAGIQTGIFERHGCTQAACHGSAPGQGGLDLRPDVAFQNLVGVASTGEPGTLRVKRGLARESVLWRKLAAATQGLPNVVGTPMPSGLPPLSESELEVIRVWIHSGAPETGVIIGTQDLLGSCLPPADPIKITPPDPPTADVGIQLHAPPWKIPARNPADPNQDGEDEVCYATWYDFSATIPASARTPCPTVCSTTGAPCQSDAECGGGTCNKIFGARHDECFFYDQSDLTQDPNSHHSIIHFYRGAWDVNEQVFVCAGGPNRGGKCNPAGADCPESTCQDQRRTAFGPFKCLGGANEGQPCDPKNVGVPAPAGADCGPDSGCAGRIQSSIACLFYGPPDFGFSVAGGGTDNAPTIGGSQQPVSSNVYPPQVFTMLPVKGTIVWNSHAFNLTEQPTTNEQWLNLFFAPPADRVYPVQPIFDATDIFVQDVPPFEKREYCRTFTLPQHARLFQLSSHTHERGELFRIWGPAVTGAPGIAERCGTGPGRIPADQCQPEAGPPIFTTTNYSDPEVLYFNPPVELDGPNPTSRTYKFCSRYDNGADNPDDVKRQSTSPLPPLFPNLEALVGGPCPDTTVACLSGPKKGQLCHGNNSECDSSPGLGDGLCDACPVHGGVTTEDEMFILLGLYYEVPPS
jgi:hypothetical protein